MFCSFYLSNGFLQTKVLILRLREKPLIAFICVAMYSFHSCWNVPWEFKRQGLIKLLSVTCSRRHINWNHFTVPTFSTFTKVLREGNPELKNDCLSSWSSAEAACYRQKTRGAWAIEVPGGKNFLKTGGYKFLQKHLALDSTCEVKQKTITLQIVRVRNFWTTSFCDLSSVKFLIDI